MSLRIYNTLSKQKENFVPLDKNNVRRYVCGPTVYDFLHVGNFRGPVFFNLVRNWLEKTGYKVTYVLNYTDVDDKIIQRANENGEDSKALADRFVLEYETDYKLLGLRKHDHNPRVTEFMPQIIDLIEKLIKEDKGYVVDGEVFYSVKSFEGYGKLSHKNIDDLLVGARVEIGEKKRNPLDFSLWKPAKPNEPKWASPWGDGRPGWHIECSAMSLSLLGEQFDIHGGGIDLIFPHHENEIAQTEGATHQPMVKYWMHNNFINLGSQKMSKSLGNFTRARGFIETYNGEILKYMLLMAHYRTHSDFSMVQIQNAIKGLARIYSGLALCETVMGKPVTEDADQPFAQALESARGGISEALNDDFNTPEVFARIFEMIRQFNAAYKPGQKVTPAIKWKATHLSAWIKEVGALMSLFQEPPGKFLRTLDDILLGQMTITRAEVDTLVAGRTQARAAKDFKKSDEIRDQLLKMGISVHDTAEGTIWEVAK
ncbi:MAG: cysteine--tRNA ligase [Bdellovibrionia bacterium]